MSLRKVPMSFERSLYSLVLCALFSWNFLFGVFCLGFLYSVRSPWQPQIVPWDFSNISLDPQEKVGDPKRTKRRQKKST